MQRSFVNILSDTVCETAKFYEELLGLKRHFESDWFVILTHEGNTSFEYGILQRDHALVPPEARAASAGGLIMTFVVEDCDQVYEIAKKMRVSVVQKPTDMPYGQRRMVLKDPEGTVLDISAPTAPLISGQN